MLRILYSVPLIGWILQDAIEGPVSSRLWFLANLGMLWFLAVYFFGVAAFIFPLLALAGIVLTSIVVLTLVR